MADVNAVVESGTASDSWRGVVAREIEALREEFGGRADLAEIDICGLLLERLAPLFAECDAAMAKEHAEHGDHPSSAVLGGGGRPGGVTH